MITEEVTRFVASAEVTDACTVEVEMREAVMRLTIPQAREFAVEIMQAIADAERAADELLREVEPASFDVAILSPDCRDGKCGACIGDAWDLTADSKTACACGCHQERAA